VFLGVKKPKKIVFPPPKKVFDAFAKFFLRLNGSDKNYPILS
jgi:hypothetical protein